MRQAPVQNWMDECPEIDEISKAIDMISYGKSPGSDRIHPEVIKRGGPGLLCALHEIIKKAWNTATVPQDWKDAQLVTIFKKDFPSIHSWKGFRKGPTQPNHTVC